MIARFIRLVERLSRLLVKVAVLGGRLTLTGADNVGARLASIRSGAGDVPAPTERRVQSLSSLVVVLLAGVVILLIWATSAQSAGSSVIQILSLGQQEGLPAPADDPSSGPAAAAIQPQQQNPQPPSDASINAAGTAVFSLAVGGQSDLFALAAGAEEVTRLTYDPAHDRDPVWSPDGTRIAFASQRDGSWDLYVLTLRTGLITRLTSDLAYEGNPTWSPDSTFLAYEAYYAGNIDINIVAADGSEEPLPLTYHPAPDTDPAWSTSETGREIAYASWREGNQEIYIISLDDPNELRARNLTQTPNINESSPAWSPDATRIAYESAEAGTDLIQVVGIEGGEPQVIGQGHSPAWLPDGSTLVFLADRDSDSLLLAGRLGAWDATVQAVSLPGFASGLSWSAASLPAVPQGELAFARTTPIQPTFTEDFATDGVSENPPYRLRQLQTVTTEGPFLADTVDASFSALRDRMRREAGWDFLGELDSAFWALERRVEPGQEVRNWHKAGRAISIRQDYNIGEPPRIEVVPVRIGPDLYWEVYVRAEVQDGSLGEPLSVLPWDLYARASGDREAYEQGGRYRDTIPAGYYVNFTEIAREYGWFPTPADSSWFYNWSGILYWQYEKREGLTWEAAMRQIWPSEELESVLGLTAPDVIPVDVPTPTSPTDG